MIGWVSAPGGQERDFILGLQGPGPWVQSSLTEPCNFQGRAND